MNILERIESIREGMREKGLNAYIIPTADPHLSEYAAPHWKMREWASGFTGSAGDLVIGEDWAGLWTDSRYYLQAEMQLEGTGIQLFKTGEPNTPSMAEEIRKHCSNGKVGIDENLISANDLRKITAKLPFNLKETHADLSYVWTDRPAMPNSEIFQLDKQYSGATTVVKCKTISFSMKTDYMLISALDEIAWLLNLRGSDVNYNPVFYAFLILGKKRSFLFVDSISEEGRNIRKNNELKTYLTGLGIQIMPYEATANTIKNIKHNEPYATWSADPNSTNAFLMKVLGNKTIQEPSVIALRKAVKNNVEIEGLRNAQIADGVALTKAFCWLDSQLNRNQLVTELSFANKVDEERSKQTNFFCPSFNTISAFGEHGAIVHYAATTQSDATLEKNNFLLLDSGGNYLNGTTDITRTVLLGGEASAEQKKDYTLVLKGHIALANAVFPVGTNGGQLDVLARQFLWKDKKNYGHGTGHGIGQFLCVHEGPQRISTKNSDKELLPNMLISNEPGYYLENHYGIRLENMVRVDKMEDASDFLHFETMSFFPFDSNAIDTELLSEEEIDWINHYHEVCFSKIASTKQLSEDEQQWLKNKTKPLEKKEKKEQSKRFFNIFA
ncbi:MAG: aminopeptidase P family protein [Paludibacteraceae bacterium]|nr:aminopeptidase P family protein [Paludibacteraceae bacterium]